MIINNNYSITGCQRLLNNPYVCLQTPNYLFSQMPSSLNNKDFIKIQTLHPKITESNLKKTPYQSFVSKLIKGTALFFAPIGSAALNIVHSAQNIIGSRFRTKPLANGRLACAYAVSTALKNANELDVKVAGCESLKQVLKKEGFQEIKVNNKFFNPQLYRAGDVVFFAQNSSGHGHVGIVSKVEYQSNGNPIIYMVHNSTSEREVKEIKLNEYSRHPISIYRPYK